MAGADVERERTESLDRVDDEVGAARAAGAPDCLEIDGVAAGEADPRDGHGAHGGILELATERLFVHPSVTRGDAAIDDTPPARELHPWIDVRGEFAIGGEHDVASA